MRPDPITVNFTVDALRELRLGVPTARPVWQALTWIGGLLAVADPAAVIWYRQTSSS